MSADELTVYRLVCDGCREAVYDDGEGSELHFESADALRFDAVNFGDWSQDGDRDLCPACTCTNIGHIQKIATGGFVYCDRCDETLLDAITASVNASYL